MDDELSRVCAELQALQRSRAALIKSRIMAANNRCAHVASVMGYSPGLEEKERKAKFAEADRLIKAIVADEDHDHPVAMFVRAAELGIAAFLRAQKATEKEMLPLAKRTPAAEWVSKPEQRGFGLLSLAVVVGECGDLRQYSNPGKLWRRMGLAPWEYGGKVQMGATWKGKGGLTAEQWSDFGYSPRRRSIAYVIGENLVKGNSITNSAGGGEEESSNESDNAAPGVRSNPTGGDARPDTDEDRATRGAKKRVRRGDDAGVTDSHAAAPGTDTTGAGENTSDTDSGVARPGPFRARYDTAKAALAARHPDDPAYPKLRCHRHGMLLATKLLLRELWRAWNPAQVVEWDDAHARELVAV